MNDQPPQEDRDRVFPTLGDEVPPPKGASGAIVPILVVVGGFLVIGLLLILFTGMRIDRDGNHLELKWGPEQSCSRPASQLCQQVDDRLASAYSEEGVCIDVEVCIVPLGGVQMQTIEALVQRLTDDLSIRVGILPPLALSDDHMGRGGSQYNADKLSSLVVSAYGDEVTQPTTLLLAVTAGDIYLPSLPNWRFAFGQLDQVGSHAVGVVSTHRLASPIYIPIQIASLFGVEISIASSQEKVEARTYKMVLKYVGLGVFHLPLTGDPQSVLYNNILSVSDLDRMDNQLPVIVHP